MSATILVIIFVVIQSLFTGFYGYAVYPVEYKEKGDVSNIYLLISFMLNGIFSVILYYAFNHLIITHLFTQILFAVFCTYKIFSFFFNKKQNHFIIDTIIILVNTLAYYEMLLTV